MKFWSKTRNLSDFDGKSAGCGSATGTKVGSELIALVRGMDIHVMTSVGPTQHWGS